ncbi:MAG: hypothetical protein NEA02_18385 [Thermoanaerobaculia bacterium]|nr:hypothetical protein [Thermoanaerobaculia bacterium]
MRRRRVLLACAALLPFIAPPARAQARASASRPPCTPAARGETVEIPEGTRLFAKPGHGADALTTVDTDLTLPVRSRCGDWIEVTYDGLRGYVLPGDAYIPPLDIGVTAAVDVTAGSFDERLVDARSAMKDRAREVPLGPWTAVTDAPAEDLEPLARVAAHVADGFAERYGLSPAPPGEQAIALFTRLKDYRAFLDAGGHPNALRTRVGGVDLSARSHVEGGIVASSLRDGPKLARIHLVHELTHLLQRRAFPGPLPRWLSEGMAEDLAWCRVDAAGRLDLGSIQGLFFMKGGVRIDVDSQGPSEALRDYVGMLRDRFRPAMRPPRRQNPALEDLLASDQPRLGTVQSGFVRGVSRRVVTGAGLFVRFLLDG